MKQKKDFDLVLSRKEFLYLLSLVSSADKLYNSDLFSHYFECLGNGVSDALALNASINDKLVSLL